MRLTARAQIECPLLPGSVGHLLMSRGAYANLVMAHLSVSASGTPCEAAGAAQPQDLVKSSCRALIIFSQAIYSQHNIHKEHRASHRYTGALSICPSVPSSSMEPC